MRQRSRARGARPWRDGDESGEGGEGGGGWDADAQAYIDATAALFPDALNTLVLGLKSNGLWSVVGALKFAIGVPTLAASLIDLRNPAFNGSAVNAPGHSATQGWSFVAASSQYINAVWQGGAAGSLSSQNSVHLGARVTHYGGSGTQYVTGNHSSGPTRVLSLVFNGTNTVLGGANDGTNITGTITPLAPAHYVMSRTGASAKAVYRDGALLQSQTLASTGVPALPAYVGAFNSVGTASLHFSGRITAWHAGGGLDAAQIAQLDALIDAYASAVGES